MAMVNETCPLFLSLGMCVLDEIHLPNGNVLKDILGGSGIYSTFGARLAAGKTDAERIACHILAGQDLPLEVEQHLTAWAIALATHILKGKPSTKGCLRYLDATFAKKTFHYLTQPLQPMPGALPGNLINASAFHFLSSPELLNQQVNQLFKVRQELGFDEQPLLFWEPAPLTCKAENFATHLEASRLVDVFSPNHVELLSLCSKAAHSTFDKGTIESCAYKWMKTKPQSSKLPRICIVRAGEHGAMIMQRVASGPKNEGVSAEWIPAFYSSAEADKVVDATGGGNTFLGAFAVAFQKNGGDAADAAKKASVCCSFALEGHGVPGMTKWNDATVALRMSEYLRKYP